MPNHLWCQHGSPRFVLWVAVYDWLFVDGSCFMIGSCFELGFYDWLGVGGYGL